MLSFVMDDPDFESDSDAPRRVVRSPEDTLSRAGQEGGVRGGLSPAWEIGEPNYTSPVMEGSGWGWPPDLPTPSPG